MGNAAVAEDLAGVDDLDQLYRLTASEAEPEDDEDDDDEKKKKKMTMRQATRSKAG